MFDGRVVRKPAKTTSDKIARQVESTERTRLAKERNGRQAAMTKLNCEDAIRCPECEQWFDAATTIKDARSGQQFCSNHCRETWSKKRRIVPTLCAFCQTRVEPWARLRPSWMWYRSGMRPLSAYSEFVDVNLDAIGTETVSAYVAHWQALGLMPATINRELRVLRRLLRLAVEWGILEKAPKCRCCEAKSAASA